MIILTRVAHRMIQHVINHEKIGSDEVALFGKVEVINGTIYITDVFVPEQEVGGAHTHMEADEVSTMYTGLIEQGEDISYWRAWIHKHPGSGASPTPGTDDTTLEALARQFSSSEELGKHFAVGIIASGTGTYGGYLHLCSPFDLPIGDVKVYIESEPLPEETITRLDLMLKGVRKKTYQHPKASGNTWNQQKKNGKPSSQGTGGTNNNGFVMPKERHDKDSITRAAWSNKWGSELGHTLDDMKVEALDDLYRVWVMRDLNNLLDDADYELVVGGNQIIRGLHKVRDKEQSHPLSPKTMHEKYHERGQWPKACTYCKKEEQEEQGKGIKVVGRPNGKKNGSKKGGK